MARAPLSVIIRPPTGPVVDVTKEYRDLTFAAETPGGFAECTFRLPRDVAFHYREILAYSDVEITAAGVDHPVYIGRIEAPSFEVDRNRSEVVVEAYGWQRHGSDQPYRGVFLDTRLDVWKPRHRAGTEAFTDTIDVRAEEDQISGHGIQLKMSFPSYSSSIAAGTQFDMVYTLPASWPGVNVSRLYFLWDADAASTALDIVVESGAGSELYRADFTTTDTAVDESGFNSTNRSAIIGFEVQAAQTSLVGRRVRFWDVRVYGTSRNQAAGGALRASDVLREVVQEVCPKWHLDIEDSAQNIDNLLYTDAVEAQTVFNEMLAFLPTAVTDDPWTWHVWEAVLPGQFASTRKYRAEVLAIPNAPKYAVSARDPRVKLTPIRFDAAEQFTHAFVSYFDPRGELQEVSRSQTIRGPIEDLGLTRSTHVGPLQVGSSTLANRIGDILLEENKRPRRSGTLVVEGGGVRDASTGAEIPAYAVLPGQRILLEDVELAARSGWAGFDERKDEFSVFVVRRTEYDDEAGRTTITLDNPTVSAENLIARLA